MPGPTPFIRPPWNFAAQTLAPRWVLHNILLLPRTLKWEVNWRVHPGSGHFDIRGIQRGTHVSGLWRDLTGVAQAAMLHTDGVLPVASGELVAVGVRGELLMRCGSRASVVFGDSVQWLGRRFDSETPEPQATDRRGWVGGSLLQGPSRTAAVWHGGIPDALGDGAATVTALSDSGWLAGRTHDGQLFARKHEQNVQLPFSPFTARAVAFADDETLFGTVATGAGHTSVFAWSWHRGLQILPAYESPRDRLIMVNAQGDRLGCAQDEQGFLRSYVAFRTGELLSHEDVYGLPQGEQVVRLGALDDEGRVAGLTDRGAVFLAELTGEYARR